MKVYNVEIFTPELIYRSSSQLNTIKYEYDYLDVTKNKIDLPQEIEVEKGDYIRIRQGNIEISGIVSDRASKKQEFYVEFKPFLKLWDIDIFMDPNSLSSQSMESWFAGIISAHYVNSPDILQNLPMDVKTSSSTMGTIISYEMGINNLFNVMSEGFTKYGIVVNVSIDLKKRKLVTDIGRCKLDKFTVEAGLKNILEKNIVYKEAREAANKVTIYNADDYSQSKTFYKTTADEVTDTDTDRMTPVIYDAAAVNVMRDKTFEESALAKAEAVMKKTKYDNLIELTVFSNDEIVRPSEREIGQDVTVINEGKAYDSILTGYKITDDEKYTLMFGIIRLEMTKQLKKKWRDNKI